MALEAKLVQKLSQQLLMTPQLQQAIKLLQLGRLEYLEAIEKELLENPVLELANENEVQAAKEQLKGEESIADQPPSVSDSSNSDSEPPKAEVDPATDWADYLERSYEQNGLSAPRGALDSEERPAIENTLTRAANLAEHILFQLRMGEIEKDQELIALQIVGNLNKDGYLCSTYEEIAEESNCALDQVIAVVEKIKNLDPPGVASRTLGECLYSQLELKGLSEGLAGKIVLNHMDKLEKRAYDKIAKIEQVAIDEVHKAVKAIQNLEPRPGRQFGEDAPNYVVPDIYVYKVGDDYVITLNEDGLPRLRVSPFYMELLAKGEAEGGANKEYINERLKAATWLIKSIHQRQRTIYRVTESIVKFQRDFFEQGISHLRPMVLKDVADDISMHESTVSRVTTNKYVHTIHGVFELKFFFTSGIKSGSGEVSSSSVKERIRTLIASESPSHPISDQEIVEILKKENVDIARRTVAKYRESLGILASSRRKKI